MITKVKPGRTIITGIKSSNVEYLEYDHNSKELIAGLKTGKYLYKEVDPKDIDKLVEAYQNETSVGKVFNQLIVKGGYKYEKIQ